MDKKLKLKIYYLFYLIPVVVMAYLFWQNSKPVLKVRCDVDGQTPLCGELVPTSRVAETKGGSIIKEEPVYFDVKLPRKYDEVEAEIKYSDLRTDIFEFGVARDAAKKSFDFAAMENKILDNSGWTKIQENGLVLYQKKPAYKNVADFQSNPPKFSETVVYRAELAPKLGKMPAMGGTIIDFPVMEGIKFLAYGKNGAPRIQADADGDFSKSVDDLGGGLYRINISGSKETIFKKISVDSPYVAIADKIKIGHLDRPLTVYFAGSRLLANAYEAGGAQTIDANGQIIDIKRIQEQYSSVFKNIKLRPVEIPKGEVELGGTLFFLSDKNIFYPRYEAFYGGADLSNINFILAKYEPPQAKNNIKAARAVFNIADTPTPGRKMRFLLSLPNAAKGELVNIKSIELKFTGKKFNISDIWHKIFK